MATKKEEHKPGSETLYISSLVDAFINNYQSVSSEAIATDVFTMGMLREYFSAYIVPGVIGDPLVHYIDELDKKGYFMRTCFDGSPGIFVRYHNRDSENISLGEDDDD